MLEFNCRRHAPDGTPVITDAGIEGYAEALVREYNPRYLKEPWELDPMKFVEFHLGANLDFADIYCEEDQLIAGATIFRKSRIKVFDRENLCTRYETYEPDTILIDNEILKPEHETFCRFTMLHEAGHFCIHRSVFAENKAPAESYAARQAILCRKNRIGEKSHKLVTQEDFREHQANTFATAVMMPGQMFGEVARRALDRMGCRDGCYLQPTLWPDDYDPGADALASYMGKMFFVSKTAAMVQLRKRGFVKLAAEK